MSATTVNTRIGSRLRRALTAVCAFALAAAGAVALQAPTAANAIDENDYKIGVWENHSFFGKVDYGDVTTWCISPHLSQPSSLTNKTKVDSEKDETYRIAYLLWKYKNTSDNTTAERVSTLLRSKIGTGLGGATGLPDTDDMWADAVKNAGPWEVVILLNPKTWYNPEDDSVLVGITRPDDVDDLKDLRDQYSDLAANNIDGDEAEFFTDSIEPQVRDTGASDTPKIKDWYAANVTVRLGHGWTFNENGSKTIQKKTSDQQMISLPVDAPSDFWMAAVRHDTDDLGLGLSGADLPYWTAPAEAVGHGGLIPSCNGKTVCEPTTENGNVTEARIEIAQMLTDPDKTLTGNVAANSLPPTYYWLYNAASGVQDLVASAGTASSEDNLTTDVSDFDQSLSMLTIKTQVDTSGEIVRDTGSGAIEGGDIVKFTSFLDSVSVNVNKAEAFYQYWPNKADREPGTLDPANVIAVGELYKASAPQPQSADSPGQSVYVEGADTSAIFGGAGTQWATFSVQNAGAGWYSAHWCIDPEANDNLDPKLFTKTPICDDYWSSTESVVIPMRLAVSSDLDLEHVDKNQPNPDAVTVSLNDPNDQWMTDQNGQPIQMVLSGTFYAFASQTEAETATPTLGVPVPGMTDIKKTITLPTSGTDPVTARFDDLPAAPYSTYGFWVWQVLDADNPNGSQYWEGQPSDMAWDSNETQTVSMGLQIASQVPEDRRELAAGQKPAGDTVTVSLADGGSGSLWLSDGQGNPLQAVIEGDFYIGSSNIDPATADGPDPSYTWLGSASFTVDLPASGDQPATYTVPDAALETLPDIPYSTYGYWAARRVSERTGGLSRAAAELWTNCRPQGSFPQLRVWGDGGGGRPHACWRGEDRRGLAPAARPCAGAVAAADRVRAVRLWGGRLARPAAVRALRRAGAGAAAGRGVRTGRRRHSVATGSRFRGRVRRRGTISPGRAPSRFSAVRRIARARSGW